jgi:parallel beta-helix repeat protein
MAKGRGIIAFDLILLCLIASSAVYFQPVKAQYQGNITINANGSITPTSAPITVSGNIYNFTSNIDGTITVKRSNIELDGNGFNVSDGLTLTDVSNITANGFVILYGWNNTHFDNNGNIDGILLSDASNVVIANNTISGFWNIYELNGVGYIGIDVEGGNSNFITGNQVLNDAVGMYFDNTQHNLIINNNIVDNASQDGLGSCGIWFWDASNNTIYHNNIIDNLPYGTPASNGDLGGNPYTPNSFNVWDDGFPAGGNYWGVQWNILENVGPNHGVGNTTVTISEHVGKEIDNTGISDTPYVLDPQNKDLYPLTEPFSPSFLANYEQEAIPSKVSVLSPLKQTYSKSNISLTLSINKPVSWISYSLDGQQNVTIIGNTTIPNITYGSHSITVYANDTFGIISGSQTIHFSVVKPFPIVTILVAVSTAIAVVIALVLLLYRRHRKTVNLSK